MKRSRHLFLNSFALKIIGMILMAFDHIGAMGTMSYPSGSTAYQVFYVFRIIGRLAFPLFIFFLAEGLRYTKDRDKYMMRLAILWVAITLVQVIAIQTGLYSGRMPPQAFTDLLMCGLVIYLIEKKKVWQKILVILPLAYIILGYACDISERYCTIHYMSSDWTTFFPYFLRCDYSVYGLLMLLGFYYGRPLARKVTAFFLEASAPLPPLKIENGKVVEEEVKEEEKTDFDVEATNEFRTLLNTINIAVIIVVNVIFYAISRIDGGAYDPFIMNFQTWAMLSAIFLVFYNGQLGYHATWWKWFEYLFYPVHLGLIYLIFYLL